jgi:hypothetical protein
MSMKKIDALWRRAGNHIRRLPAVNDLLGGYTKREAPSTNIQALEKLKSQAPNAVATRLIAEANPVSSGQSPALSDAKFVNWRLDILWSLELECWRFPVVRHFLFDDFPQTTKLPVP